MNEFKDFSKDSKLIFVSNTEFYPKCMHNTVLYALFFVLCVLFNLNLFDLNFWIQSLKTKS